MPLAVHRGPAHAAPQQPPSVLDSLPADQGRESLLWPWRCPPSWVPSAEQRSGLLHTDGRDLRGHLGQPFCFCPRSNSRAETKTLDQGLPSGVWGLGHRVRGSWAQVSEVGLRAASYSDPGRKQEADPESAHWDTPQGQTLKVVCGCLLYTSDAADDTCVV